MSETTAPAPQPESDASAVVPRWLVVTVVVLLIVVVGVGVIVVRTVTGERRFATPAERDIYELSIEVRRDPTDVSTRLALAYAYQQAGRYAEAVSEYEAVLVINPEETAALYNKGVSLLELGRDAEGEELLRQTLAVRPDHALAAGALAVRLEERGEWAELAEVLLPVLEADEKAADLQALLGRAYEELGDTERALERYELALTYDPEMTDALEGFRRLELGP